MIRREDNLASVANVFSSLSFGKPRKVQAADPDRWAEHDAAHPLAQGQQQQQQDDNPLAGGLAPAGPD